MLLSHTFYCMALTAALVRVFHDCLCTHAALLGEP